MRKKQHLLFSFFVFLLGICMTVSIGVTAADRLVLYTDITANINGYDIPAYSIDGQLVVVVSDLENYGFQTKYDNATRTTTITKADATTITPILSGKNYNHANVYDTDIRLIVCGKTVSGYNVAGKMTIPFSALAPFGTYHYDNDTRTSSLTIAGLPTAPKKERLTVVTTDKKLCLNGVDLYGVVKIGNEYGIPTEVLTDENWVCLREKDAIQRDYNTSMVRFSEIDTMYTIYFDDGRWELCVGTYTPSYVHREQIVLGTAVKANKKLYASDRKTELGDVYLIDEHYPIVLISAIGAMADGENFKLDTVEKENRLPVQYDKDLLGDILPSLCRDTPYDTVLAIHDYIVNTLTYDPTVKSLGQLSDVTRATVEKAKADAENTYILANNVTLATKYGVCANYSQLFRSMCNRVGIPCIYIIGSAAGDSHAWNMVYIDGKWQYVDCTWDDPVTYLPELRHDYFLIHAERIANDHIWSGSDYPMPDAYDPNWENLDPMHLTSADQFRKCVAAQLKQGKTHFTLHTTEYGGIIHLNQYNTKDLFVHSLSMYYDSASYSYVFDVEYWDLSH